MKVTITMVLYLYAYISLIFDDISHYCSPLDDIGWKTEPEVYTRSFLF